MTLPTLKHLRIATNGIHLHVAVAGDGAPVLLLHGFPEHWWSWRHQLPALSEAGLSAWALDLRGYNLSERPIPQAAYRVSELVEDIAGVVRATGHQRCDIIGHDWGGLIAWKFADKHPELLRRLVVLNAPHPALFARELRRPRQLLRSAYALFFGLPVLPEAVLAANDFAVLRALLSRTAMRPDAYRKADIDAFIAPFRTPGRLTAALNYYRANLWSVGRHARRMRPIAADTLVLWGERDPALNVRLLDSLDQVAPRAYVERFPQASHFVQSDEHERVNDAIVNFLR